MSTWMIWKRECPNVIGHAIILKGENELTELFSNYIMYIPKVEYILYKTEFQPKSVENAIKFLEYQNFPYQFDIKITTERSNDFSKIRKCIFECFSPHKFGVFFSLNESAKASLGWTIEPIDAIQKYLSTSFEAKHVLVFDLDETLITSDEIPQLRDENLVYFLKNYKKKANLILWSYGCEDHVLNTVKQYFIGIFDIIICEGRKPISENDNENLTKYSLTQNEQSLLHLPKKCSIVLNELRKIGRNYTKFTILVDDLEKNMCEYDYYIKCIPCHGIMDDWKDIDSKIERIFNNWDRRQI